MTGDVGESRRSKLRRSSPPGPECRPQTGVYKYPKKHKRVKKFRPTTLVVVVTVRHRDLFRSAGEESKE